MSRPRIAATRVASRRPTQVWRLSFPAGAGGAVPGHGGHVLAHSPAALHGQRHERARAARCKCAGAGWRQVRRRERAACRCRCCYRCCSCCCPGRRERAWACLAHSQPQMLLAAPGGCLMGRSNGQARQQQGNNGGRAQLCRLLVMACDNKVVLHDIGSRKSFEVPRAALDGKSPTCVEVLGRWVAVHSGPQLQGPPCPAAARPGLARPLPPCPASASDADCMPAAAAATNPEPCLPAEAARTPRAAPRRPAS